MSQLTDVSPAVAALPDVLEAISSKCFQKAIIYSSQRHVAVLTNIIHHVEQHVFCTVS